MKHRGIEAKSQQIWEQIVYIRVSVLYSKRVVKSHSQAWFTQTYFVWRFRHDLWTVCLFGIHSEIKQGFGRTQASQQLRRHSDWLRAAWPGSISGNVIFFSLPQRPNRVRAHSAPYPKASWGSFAKCCKEAVKNDAALSPPIHMASWLSG